MIAAPESNSNHWKKQNTTSWNFLSETNAQNCSGPSKYSLSLSFSVVEEEIRGIVVLVVLGISVPRFQHWDWNSSVSQRALTAAGGTAEVLAEHFEPLLLLKQLQLFRAHWKCPIAAARWPLAAKREEYIQ